MASTSPPEYHRQKTSPDIAPNEWQSTATAGNLPPAALIIRRKKVTAEEAAVLLAMLEVGDSTGGYLHIRIPRIADHASLSERTVQRVLWGRKPIGSSNPHHVPGQRDQAQPTPGSLVGRGIVQELAPANTTKRRCTTFAIHADVLQDDPRKCRWYEQRQLPWAVTEQEVMRWCLSHSREMKLIKAAIAEFASQGRTHHDTPFSLKAAQTFAIQTARRHGMPYRLASKAVKDIL